MPLCGKGVFAVDEAKAERPLWVDSGPSLFQSYTWINAIGK
jgi:hypothetical protein